MRATFRTIEIDFTVERADVVFRKKHTASGKLVMLRQDGKVFGKLHFIPDDDPIAAEAFVIRDGGFSYWNARTKTVMNKSVVNADDGFRFAADHCSGLLWLLNREDARQHLKATVFKQDAHFAYFDVKVDETPRFSFGRSPRPQNADYRFAVTTSESVKFPKHIICQIYRALPNGDTQLYKVTKWVVDSPEHAKLSPSDFPDPAKPPEGWKVHQIDWSIRP
jgi:hypothetical protein